MIIDGKKVTIECRECGTRFEHVVGTGPMFPSDWLIDRILREHPATCPKCGSRNTRRVKSVWDHLPF